MIMKLTQLETMEQVQEATRVALAMPMDSRKARCERARRLADLFDMQAQMLREAGHDKNVDVPEIYRAACFVAANSFLSRARQFQTEAGAR